MNSINKTPTGKVTIPIVPLHTIQPNRKRPEATSPREIQVKGKQTRNNSPRSSPLRKSSESPRSGNTSPNGSPGRHAGKSAGSDTQDDEKVWAEYIEDYRLDTFASMYKLYAYDGPFTKKYWWAKVFRAGVAVIYQNPADTTDCELLMVHHKPPREAPPGKPDNIGPPKGLKNPNEYSALGTALRELREETSINVFDSSLNAKLLLSVIVNRRPEFTMQEVIIYFIVYVDRKPEVTICNEELTGYDWYDMSNGFKDIPNVSTPTRNFLDKLERMDMFTPPTVYVQFPAQTTN
ncbi:hypothetical protein PV-S19_0220 [Pacmanvirus S19]|nr:hypothetical protein PV-S19_0220 [Pacmanvirus S19]